MASPHQPCTHYCPTRNRRCQLSRLCRHPLPLPQALLPPPNTLTRRLPHHCWQLWRHSMDHCLGRLQSTRQGQQSQLRPLLLYQQERPQQWPLPVSRCLRGTSKFFFSFSFSFSFHSSSSFSLLSYIHPFSTTKANTTSRASHSTPPSAPHPPKSSPFSPSPCPPSVPSKTKTRRQCSSYVIRSIRSAPAHKFTNHENAHPRRFDGALLPCTNTILPFTSAAMIPWPFFFILFSGTPKIYRR
jgi:hypothetical protein